MEIYGTKLRSVLVKVGVRIKSGITDSKNFIWNQTRKHLQIGTILSTLWENGEIFETLWWKIWTPRPQIQGKEHGGNPFHQSVHLISRTSNFPVKPHPCEFVEIPKKAFPRGPARAPPRTPYRTPTRRCWQPRTTAAAAATGPAQWTRSPGDCVAVEWRAGWRSRATGGSRAGGCEARGCG